MTEAWMRATGVEIKFNIWIWEIFEIKLECIDDQLDIGKDNGHAKDLQMPFIKEEKSGRMSCLMYHLYFCFRFWFYERGIRKKNIKFGLGHKV